MESMADRLVQEVLSFVLKEAKDVALGTSLGKSFHYVVLIWFIVICTCVKLFIRGVAYV